MKQMFIPPEFQTICFGYEDIIVTSGFSLNILSSNALSSQTGFDAPSADERGSGSGFE